MHTRNMMVAVLSVAVLAGIARAEMDASQKKWFGEATKYIEQGEANLKSAQDGVGAGQVTASKAKLALMRMGAVKTAYGNANIRIEKLPADDAGVVALAARSKALEEATTTFEQSLLNPDKPAAPAAQPGDAPKAAGQGAAAKPAGGAKLNYKQEESLKNARFHSSDVAGKAQAIAGVAATISKATDPNTIDYRLMGQAMNTIVDARRKIENANTHLAAVPEDGAGVPEVAEQVKTSAASIDASEKVIAPAYEKLMGLLNPKNSPTLDIDLKRLQELGQMYGDATVLTSNYSRAGDMVTEISASAKEHDRIVSQYALMINQKTEIGEGFAGASRNFKAKMEEFIKVGMEQKSALPGSIDADLANASKLADEATSGQKPAFFSAGGGIEQNMDFAVGKLVLLKALDADAAKTASDKIDTTRKQMKERQNSLRDGIINANQLPNDNYKGADRAELEKLAIETWKKTQPDAEVLKIRIPSQNWDRESLWRYSNQSWRFVDYSKLQVQVILKFDGKLAINRPVNLWKDHTKNDQINADPFDTKDDEVPPQRYYLIEKAK